jgi:2-polyprenyl-3-methyl-5-hydroxy-6-metoxy-1,4-benzoquinol methylase
MTPPTLGCPACHGTRFRRAFGVGAAEVWRCGGCGLGATVPPPQEADGCERFANDPVYFASAYAQPKDRWWNRFRNAPLDFLEAAPGLRGRRLLDLGCGLGYLVARAGERGFEAAGLDSSAAAVTFGHDQLGLRLACARIEDASLDPASRDIVVLNHVLEHLPDPGMAVRRAREWLRPGGWLLVGAPNFASPIARWSGQDWTGLVPSQHIWHLTPRALRHLTREAGFTRMLWTTRMLAFSPAHANDWIKWVGRRLMEPLRLADNLLLLTQRPE